MDSKINMGITAVIFDLDNTLTDRAESIRHFSRQFFQDFKDMLHELVSFDEVQRVINIGDGSGYRPKAMLFQEIQTELRWVDMPTLATISDYWYRVSAQRMVLRSGVQMTLEALQQRGYTLGMITNGQTNVQNATIDATKLRAYFSNI
ncbi:MAG: HAD hydrolase-like protein, partial [Armatimonadetes bacterium]|nr:HAD hydrolase-like protein [Anaerolineae bacterium]